MSLPLHLVTWRNVHAGRCDVEPREHRLVEHKRRVAVAGLVALHALYKGAEAVEAGREEARRAKREHIIKNENGQIAERNSYGNDPRDVQG